MRNLALVNRLVDYNEAFFGQVHLVPTVFPYGNQSFRTETFARAALPSQDYLGHRFGTKEIPNFCQDCFRTVIQFFARLFHSLPVKTDFSFPAVRRSLPPFMSFKINPIKKPLKSGFEDSVYL